MSRAATHCLLIALPALALTACGGRQNSDEPTRERMPSPELEATVDEDGRRIRRFDIDLDGDPDIFKIFVAIDEDGDDITDPYEVERGNYDDLRIVERQLDTNLDGMIDVIRFYTRGEEVEREQVDVDFDGIVDYENLFEEGSLSQRRADFDSDGVLDEVRYYRSGALHRIESDTDDDGDTDVWAYYDNSTLQRVGTDLNGDGVIDEWQRLTEGSTEARPTSERFQAEQEAAANAGEAADPNAALEGRGDGEGEGGEGSAPDGADVVDAPVPEVETVDEPPVDGEPGAE